MKLVKRKSDGYLIEVQKDTASDESLLNNAQAAGYLPSEVEIEFKSLEECAEIIGQQNWAQLNYKQRRLREYPPIGDQLDAILKYFQTQPGLSGELTAIIESWVAVKQKYPKV